MSKNSYRYFIIILTSLTLGYFACKETPAPIAIITAAAIDFDEESSTHIWVADSLLVKLWAPGPLLCNAVALTVDQKGVVYVSSTSRRKSSDLDIREHPDWQNEDLALRSIEDTRAFHIRKLATQRSEENTWLEDHNQDGIRDYRDLTVQSESIIRIWDSDGDGRADVSQKYAEGFQDIVTGIAAGIMSHGDDIYLTVAPDLWKLRDKNGDGVADVRSSVSYGYGIHIAFAGHDMSGLTMGPDGKIYWSIGDMGVNSTDDQGNNYAYPHEGCVMRANPDGTELEVYAHGLRNPQEIDFDAYGNLITVDNDGDHPGEHERYVHIVEGSDSGWRIHWQYGKYELPNETYKVWMDEKLYLPHFEGQASYLLPPLALAYDGPAGLAYNPGTALSPRYKNHFFASYFTGNSANSKIQAFSLSPRGASFEVATEVDILTGIVPTGISFGPDGGLYINDWKDSYDKKPEGRIWKLNADSLTRHPLTFQTQSLLLQGTKKLKTDALISHLTHEDKRVRQGAQFELVKRGETAVLIERAYNGRMILERLHAIWGLGQIIRKEPQYIAEVLGLLADPDAHVRSQVAKIIGDAHDSTAVELLIPMLQDVDSRVQFFAAEALGKTGSPSTVAPLLRLLEQVNDKDPHLRHAVIYALSRVADSRRLANLSTHPSIYVRLGAVVALRIKRSPAIAEFVGDIEPLVVVEAARAINDDASIPEALPTLAQSLSSTDSNNEAYLRRAINANLRLADGPSAIRLARYAADDTAPSAMRSDALWALGYWPKPLVLDRVDGSYRKIEGHRIEDAHAAIDLLIPLLNQSISPEIKADILTLIGRARFSKAEKQLMTALTSRYSTTKMQQAAMESLGAIQTTALIDAIRYGLIHQNEAIRNVAQNLITTSKLSPAEQTDLLKQILEQNTLPEKQKAIYHLSQIKDTLANAIIESYLQQLYDGHLDKNLEWDIIKASKQIATTRSIALLQQYNDRLDSKSKTEQYSYTLYGGQPSIGKQILYNNASAQCLRCHAVNGEGGKVGPALTHIAQVLSREHLLEALIEPNARIADGYGSVYITLKNGTELSGILLHTAETHITLSTHNDEGITIATEDITTIENLPSGMVDMTEILNPGQIRDLVAYLATLK